MIIKLKEEKYETPFPQANDVYKILKYVNNQLGNIHQRTFKYISDDYVDRQKLYYKSAAQYLGYLDENGPTTFTLKIFMLDPNFIFVYNVHQILSHEIFYNFYVNRNVDMVIQSLIKNYSLSPITAARRTSTVKSWIEWCDLIIKENRLEIIDGNK